MSADRINIFSLKHTLKGKSCVLQLCHIIGRLLPLVQVIELDVSAAHLFTQFVLDEVTALSSVVFPQFRYLQKRLL